MRELLRAVARREVDMVAAWAVDRLGRSLDSIRALVVAGAGSQRHIAAKLGVSGTAVYRVCAALKE